ncbi:MAG: protein adenylyltransferase SelO family protein, partial [Pseudomonadota bacterium]|nr:protein adenylyltransferase SelO family protein [Pseudomonadota bacterium]
GETIYRDGPKPGAVLTRVAASHLRVGTFQYFAARGETDKVRQLADYAIDRHDPDLAGQPDRYIRLFRGVVERQAALVANWVLVGFVHGVMNTDNTTISGETIDYGPCAFIDAYDPAAVFSSIDHGGRYAFGRQPVIMQWNLARLAETLLPLIQPDDLDKAVELASAELGRFPDIYRAAWLNGMRAKLGLVEETAEDQDLFETMLSVLQEQSVDYTLFFRHLSEAAVGEPQKLRELFVDPTQIDGWLKRWMQRLESEGRAPADTRTAMNLVNPLYIPRNHKVEEALQSAETGEYFMLNELLDVLKAPYEERTGFESYALPAPEAFGPYQTFCGT